MKKLLLIALSALALNVQAQQVNGTFDAWEDCIPWTSKDNTKTQGTEPQGWQVSNVIGMSGLGATTIAEAVIGRDGTGYAVQLSNTANTLSKSQIIPAYLTLGTPWNTSTGLTTITNKDGGTFGGTENFSYIPDAVHFYYKRSVSDATSSATLVGYLWKGTTTQADVPGNTIGSNPTKVTMTDRDRNILDIETSQGGTITKSEDFELIASYNETLSTTATDWTEMTVPFTYVTSSTPEKINLIFAASEYFSTTVPSGSVLTIDDVTLLYYSELESVTYDGVSYEVAESMTINENYDASKLTLTSNGAGATIDKSYDATTKVLTVTVKGNDIDSNADNYHTYTIQFGKTKTFTDNLVVTIDGESTDPMETDVIVTYNEDGTIDFSLTNFTLSGIGAVGNINIEGLKLTEADGYSTFSYEGFITITEGDDENVDSWLGPLLGEVPVELTGDITDDNLHVTIDIDMSETIGQIIYVEFGVVILDEEETISTTNRIAGVIVNRTLKAGWNSIMLPFEVAATDIASGAYFATYEGSTTSGDNITLNFTKAESLTANTPALLNMPEDVTDFTSFTVKGVTLVEADAATVSDANYSLVGLYTPLTSGNTTIVAGDYGVISSGLVRVAGSNAIKSMSAYLKAASTSTTSTVRMVVDGEEATAIEAVEMLNALTDGEAYDLTGRKANSKTKGIVIVNGKKVVR